MARESPSEVEVHTISCPCGAPLSLKMKSLKPVEVCPECQASLTIVVTVDPGTQKKRIGILVNSSAVVIPPKRSAKSAPRAPKKVSALSGSHNPKCACGARVPVDLGSVDSVYSCPWCGACYTAVAKRDEATGLDLPLLMPVEVVSLRKDSRKKTRRILPSQRPSLTPTPASLPGKEGEEAKSHEALWAQPLIEQEKSDLVACSCGEEIVVKKDDHKKILKCPGCGRSFRFVLAFHPKSKKPMAVMVPRS